MIGAIVGDIVGSIYEFNNHKSKDFELFGEGCSFTDDTVHTIAVAEWMMIKDYYPSEPEDPDPDIPSLTELLVLWSNKYPHCSYGGMFQQWLSGREYEGKYKPYNSYGNGSAMRVSPVAWFPEHPDEVAKQSAEVTHSHPEGIRGAQAVAHAIWSARRGSPPALIKREVTDRYGYDLTESVDSIRTWYDFDETCQGTVPQAIICALEAASFEDAIRNAISIGGDSDTVGAIAGSIAEARLGVPADIKDEALEYLPDDMQDVVERFHCL